VQIDTGINAMGDLIVQTIRDTLDAPEAVRVIVNTHGHHDHIGANHQVGLETGALLASPLGAVPWIEDYDTHYREFCLVEPGILPDADWMRQECFSVLGRSIHVDLTLGEGDRLLLGGGVELEVLFLPGHMVAEIGFVERATNTLILGDAIINNTIVDIGPLFHGYQDAAAYKATLARLRCLMAEGRFECIVSAHLPLVDWSDALELIDRAQSFVSAVESDLITLVESQPEAKLDTIWGGLCGKWGYREEFRGLAMVMTHLDLLVRSGVLVQDETGAYNLP
jgi:glyoxylase-like metal-dependent hydrolase (beta-lactamase superfamily II)